MYFSFLTDICKKNKKFNKVIKLTYQIEIEQIQVKPNPNFNYLK